MRVDDGSALSLSMFDVGGERNSKGVKGFIYGERGVWRPGDSLFLSFILEDKNESLPEDHPVVFELYTPENQLFQRMVKTNGLNGFYDLRTATASTSPTGNWLAKVKVGNSSFSKSLKIEAVKPNRLKIKVEFEDKVLSKGNTDGTLSAKWLHGADADGLRATMEMNLSSGNTSFEEHPDYHQIKYKQGALGDLARLYETIDWTDSLLIVSNWDEAAQIDYAKGVITEAIIIAAINAAHSKRTVLIITVEVQFAL